MGKDKLVCRWMDKDELRYYELFEKIELGTFTKAEGEEYDELHKRFKVLTDAPMYENGRWVPIYND